MPKPLLRVEELNKTYLLGKQRVAVLRDISFTVGQGEFVAITGASGSGKSTLLALLGGLDQADSGRIFLGQEEISKLNEKRLAVLRNRRIGFVFQSFHLAPSLNAFENVAFPAELAGDREAAAKAERLLRRVDLWPRYGNFPSQLSGGERQRVAICRALINTPSLILADEPTGNLDSAAAALVLDLLLQIKDEYGVTLVMVTHSPEVAARAGRVIRLSDGRIAA
ncbi:MAG: ABC transporter ATP-binding protein [Desulfobulbaceae bacterium]|jgi:putative ABC transport system ATP-binding protein|nr:ABC transporter ATP-binding protein [Desulfobulbaceae bacterium]